MVLRLNQVAAEFRKVSNKQMAETTKRTIRENVSINSQLSKMSDKTMELIQENDELKAKEKKMKLQIDMLEYNEKELAKKNSSNLKVLMLGSSVGGMVGVGIQRFFFFGLKVLPEGKFLDCGKKNLGIVFFIN